MFAGHNTFAAFTLLLSLQVFSVSLQQGSPFCSELYKIIMPRCYI